MRRERQLAGKERTIARLRAGRQADRDRARAAEVVAAAAERRAERAIESMGRDQHAANRKHAALADALRKKDWDLKQERRTVESLREALGKAHAAADGPVPAHVIRRQWEALAVRIARQASGKGAVPLAGLDQEVVSTWQQLRQQAPMVGTTKTPTQQPPRPARPATPPRRRNR